MADETTAAGHVYCLSTGKERGRWNYCRNTPKASNSGESGHTHSGVPAGIPPCHDFSPASKGSLPWIFHPGMQVNIIHPSTLLLFNKVLSFLWTPKCDTLTRSVLPLPKALKKSLPNKCLLGRIKSGLFFSLVINSGDLYSKRLKTLPLTLARWYRLMVEWKNNEIVIRQPFFP